MSSRRSFPALRVRQWLSEWDEVAWSEAARQRRPEPFFYLTSLPAKTLRQLSGVYPREALPDVPRTRDSGPQRAHDKQRSKEIGRFIQYGFPWSDLSPARRASNEFNDLRKPGWLPTSIVVNILKPGEKRGHSTLSEEEAVLVEDDGIAISLLLPTSSEFEIPPVEVIDGQHRLWAFDQPGIDDSFELPIVAFHGLDRSWQAYLFWTINIKPKRINASLAFDLYPLLRGEDWLDRFYGHSIYRETRAQELVETVWSLDGSPWYGRINMLGEKGFGKSAITQAAWIRSLMSTFLRPWNIENGRIGGLFGAPPRSDELVLGWSRSTQAALLVLIWSKLDEALSSIQGDALQNSHSSGLFEPENGLIVSDQGVRGVLYTFNDLLVASHVKLRLQELDDTESDGEAPSSVESSLQRLDRSEELVSLVEEISTILSKFDWRPFTSHTLDDDQRREKAAYRGSGGYSLLRDDLLDWVTQHARSSLLRGAVNEVRSSRRGDRD